jgi:cell division septal protein FtsQ
MKKNKSRKPKKSVKIFLLIISLFLLAFISAYLLCAYVFEVKAYAVIIKGNNIITDNEILEYANIIDYPNFVLTNTKKIEKQLEKQDLIKDAKVKKNNLFQIHITIKENKPLFIREDINKIVLDTKKEIPNDKTKNLNIPYLINYVPNTKYDKLIERIKQIDYNLLKKVSQIKYDPNKYDEDRFLLYMNDSNRVYINLQKFKNFNKYDEMVTKFEGKTGTLYLDSGNYFEIDK